VAEDVENRLRAALRAHAALVEDPPEGAVRPAPPATAGRRWGGSVLVAAAAAAAAAVVAGGLWLGGGTPDRAAAPPSDGPVAATVPADPSDEVSAAAPPEVGSSRPFDLYTHCGVLGADIDGVWFAADPPLTDGDGNPPDGWGNPYQPGTLTLASSTEAVFRDDAGHEVVLRAVEDSARPRPCG
jgi:hypothetical protein